MEIVTVKLHKGPYLLQVTSSEARWGFYLTDGESCWDGGFGIADNVPYVVSSRKLKKFERCINALKSGLVHPRLERYTMTYAET